MRILFNLIGCSLGNNGGSLTLIKSANTLQELGHKVIMVDSMKNQHTWTPLKVPHIICKSEKDIPTADFIIATGYKTWMHTLKLPDRCGRKFVWLRGWERWNASEEQMISVLSDDRIIKLANGKGIQNRLKKYNINSFLVMPGNDFQDFYPMHKRDKNKVILGGLYNTRHQTKRSVWIINVAKRLKQKYNNIELYMFGANKNVNDAAIDVYYCQPTIEQKNIMFNKIDIFLAPTSLEGLHIVPQEAMLTECVVVGTDAELAGLDYITHEYSGLISSNNFARFCKLSELLVVDEKLRLRLGLNARLAILARGDRKDNMKNFVKTIMENIK